MPAKGIAGMPRCFGLDVPFFPLSLDDIWRVLTWIMADYV
jgi:hypothetical protein